MLKKLALYIPKVRKIKEQIESMRVQIKDLELLNEELIKKNKMSLRLLEGTPYSTIALPLDYPPSRDYKPRWGNVKPVEPIIHSWFKKNTDNFINLCNEMKKFAEELKQIPLIFEAKNLPEFGWIGIPYSPF